jgi:integrase
MRGKITIGSVKALSARVAASGREETLRDTALAGFEARARTDGAKVAYAVRYRAGSGRQAPMRRVTIGKHGSPWTPETARAEAKRLLALVAYGKDPAGAKATAKAAPTVADLAQRFLAEHAEAKRKASTAKEYRRLLDHVVLPTLGKKRVADITPQDVARLHHARRATPTEANRALAVISAMLNMAERWGERPDGSNPCRHVEKFPQRKRERMLSADELARLGEVLAGYDGSPYYAAAIKLLIFTGARLGEILGLQWQWIDFKHCEARLPDSKTGAKTLHLPPPALAVLAELPHIAGNPYVIVGGVADAALVNLEKPWRAIRKKAGLEDVRLHDLRHSFASVAASCGMGLPIIGRMLGHTQAQTTQRYAHLASDPVKAAAATIAGKIAAAMSGGKGDDAAATVVELRSGA